MEEGKGEFKLSDLPDEIEFLNLNAYSLKALGALIAGCSDWGEFGGNHSECMNLRQGLNQLISLYCDKQESLVKKLYDKVKELSIKSEGKTNG